MKKRLISIFTISIILLNAVFSSGFTVKSSPHFIASGVFEQTVAAAESGSGYIPRPVSVAPSSNEYVLKSAAVYPSYYNSADLGYTSGVDNQQSSDICWAFTHNELLEINLAKKYGVHYDFSEQAMKFETSYITEPLYGYMRYPNGSGNEFFSTAYLARTGSVLESDEPFTLSEERTAEVNSLERLGWLVSVPMYEFGLNTDNSYNAQAVDTIKSLILEYGAAASALYYNQSNSYQQAERINYYYNGVENTPNHSVTIVGWDDNYSAENFVKTPAGDGAFIVKNSWGFYHNNQSTDYVYVSYYDKHITNQIFTTDYEIENDLYDNVYQYDPLGWVQNLGLEGSVLCVTRFVADAPDETVTAVSTYITEPNVTAKIMISTTGDFQNKNNYKTVCERTFDAAGYYVMPITPTQLSGNEYYVAVQLTSESDLTTFAIQSDVRRLVDNSVNIPNTCYIGNSFSELYTIEDVCDILNSQTNNANEKIYNPMLCIKAFTKSGESGTLFNIGAFTDVEDSRWYASAVDYAVGAGLFSGVSETSFEPNTQMTRAMFVKVLANLTNIDTSSYTGNSFTDVEKGRWYTDAVSWAEKNGIVDGITETTFAPYQSISRQQMCVMLIRYSAYLGIAFEPADDSFTFDDDSMIQNYARDAVYTCRKYGIISGMTETTFDPRSGATRAQVANLFMNFCQKYIY